MRCPFCGYSESKVIDSRPADEGSSIRRRRECLSCSKRFTTYETVESLPMMVVKKDGSRQSFDRRKVLGGMIRACEKRPVPLAELERIAGEIEQDLQNSMEREISTETIGERVMERLRAVDQVAYVRFASVYRQFKDIDTFMAELEKIAGEIEQDLQNSMEREISTETIGERVMERLRSVDQVAYVRFASVYRQFKDIDTFMAELNKLLAEK